MNDYEAMKNSYQAVTADSDETRDCPMLKTNGNKNHSREELIKKTPQPKDQGSGKKHKTGPRITGAGFSIS